MALSADQDAYGRLLLDYLETGRGTEIVEREDGFIQASPVAPANYFAAVEDWDPTEREAIELARGRVLDVGAGAGRVSLHLQERGLEVVAIDVSPGAVEVCRRRGVRDARELAVTQVDSSLGRFDTMVMFGNNFGLMGGERRGRWLLRRFRSLTNEGARILASSRDVYQTDDPGHLAYQERNRRRGRMAGQIRLRIRHRHAKTPWFDYVMVSPDEMRELAAGTGWQVARIIGDEPLYTAMLERAS